MKLDKLWRDIGVSESDLAKIRRDSWFKSDDFTLEESLYLCDAMCESCDLPPLSAAAKDIAETLQGTKWAFCGGTAINKLVEPRMTQDVDVVVADRSSAISQLLRTHKFSAYADGLRHESGAKVDVVNYESGNLECPKQVALQALDTARLQRLFGFDVPLVSPAGLIAMKLGRACSKLPKAEQDQHDIISLLVKFGHQDLSRFSLTVVMRDEYKRLATRAEQILKG